jgi:hypothetical protein
MLVGVLFIYKVLLFKNYMGTDFFSMQIKKDFKLKSLKSFMVLWELTGSNRRPSACKAEVSIN